MIPLRLENVKTKIIYHSYQGFEVKTLVVSLKDKLRILNTREGYREASFVINHYNPRPLWDSMQGQIEEFEEGLPLRLGLPPGETTLLTTAADMDNLAVCTKNYEEFVVCCLVTAGVKNNAQRIGEDEAILVERDGRFESSPGTINIILLTNTTLTDAAMARTIITATEAKTADLQDLDIRSSYTPQNQAAGTGTDNIIVVSGNGPLVMGAMPRWES